MTADERSDLLGMHRVAVLDRLHRKIEELIDEHAAIIPAEERENFDSEIQDLHFFPSDVPVGDCPEFPENLFGDEAMKDFVSDQFDPAAGEVIAGMMEIAEIAMPDTYFESDSRVNAARDFLKKNEKVSNRD